MQLGGCRSSGLEHARRGQRQGGRGGGPPAVAAEHEDTAKARPGQARKGQERPGKARPGKGRPGRQVVRGWEALRVRLHCLPAAGRAGPKARPDLQQLGVAEKKRGKNAV